MVIEAFGHKSNKLNMAIGVKLLNGESTFVNKMFIMLLPFLLLIKLIALLLFLQGCDEQNMSKLHPF